MEHNLDADARLRKFGFKIFARHGNARALWERGGKLYTVTEALTVIRREVKELEKVKV